MATFAEKINEMRIFQPGSADLKGVADVQLPSFEPLTDTISGAGVMGEYESVTFGQFGSMKFVLNWRMITEEIKSFLTLNVVPLDCRLVNQVFDITAGSQKFVANRVYVRGQVTKNDFGKAAKGSAYEGSTEIEVTYILIEYDGKPLVELDKFNYVYKVGGVDLMKEIRQALGMS